MLKTGSHTSVDLELPESWKICPHGSTKTSDQDQANPFLIINNLQVEKQLDEIYLSYCKEEGLRQNTELEHCQKVRRYMIKLISVGKNAFNFFGYAHLR